MDLATDIWTDSGLGLVAPDNGSTTTRTVTESPMPMRYYRVQASLPLAP
jgi:hypothetical protein